MQNNLPFNTVYFKGSGLPNGVPVYIPQQGLFTLGGYQSASDLGGNAYFGALMSSNPLDPDGAMFVGIPSGYVIRGVVIYDSGVAENDPAKPNYILQGAPITVLFHGAMWFYSWNKTGLGSIDPVPGAVMMTNNTTGEIQFLPAIATSAPTGWTILNGAKGVVKSITDDGKAAMCFIDV
jgi:hypothetical protein